MRGPFEYIFRYEQARVTRTRHPHSGSRASLETGVNQPCPEVYKENDASSCRQFIEDFDFTRLLFQVLIVVYVINTGLCFSKEIGMCSCLSLSLDVSE